MPKIIDLGYNRITDLLDKADFDPNARASISIPGSNSAFEALVKQRTDLQKARISYKESLLDKGYSKEDVKKMINARYGSQWNNICKKIDVLSSIPLLHLAIARQGVKLPITRYDAKGDPIFETHSEAVDLLTRLLADSRINIHALGPYHETALHRAVEAMDIATARVLTDGGINISITNKFGQTAYDKALDLYKTIARNPHLTRDRIEEKLNLIHQLMTLTAPAGVIIPARTELDLSLAHSAARAAATKKTSSVPGKSAKVYPASMFFAAGAAVSARGDGSKLSVYAEPDKEAATSTDLKTIALEAIVTYKSGKKPCYGTRRAQALINALNDSTCRVDVVGILSDFLASGIVSTYESTISAFFSGACPSSAATEGSLLYTLREALSITAVDQATIKAQLTTSFPISTAESVEAKLRAVH